MAAPLLEIRNVKKYYPVKKVRNGEDISVKAVDQIDLTVNQGEIVGLVGESGCGKSTLGKTILKLHDITGGQILFHGEDITNYTEKQMRPLREKIQIIFQDPYASLNPKKKVVQSVMTPLDVSGKYTKEEKLFKKKTDTFSGVYWCLTTAIYLAWSFWTMSWDITWIVWPVAGVLFAALLGVVKMVLKNGRT